MLYTPHPYQAVAARFMRDNLACFLMLDMGLGKTVVSLSTIHRLRRCCDIGKVLVIAPRLVTEQTWTSEQQKWDHLKGLKISRVIGSADDRKAALAVDADVYAVSRDNVAWLIDHYGSRFPFDWVIVDESSSFKNPSSKRFKALRKIRGMVHRFTLLSGTPAPNGLMDLWSQMFLLDGGERLERTIGGFRTRYFNRIRKGDEYAIGYELKPGAKESIYRKIDDICLSMKAEDWLDIPERIDVVQHVELPNMLTYKRFEQEKILELLSLTGEGVEISPPNVGVLYNKLLQFSNGAVYDDERTWHGVSDAKLDVLEENIEALNGKPVLVFYQFQSDIDRIMARIPGVTRFVDGSQVDQWNAGEIPILLAHGASAAHGLNMQDGGNHVIWYGLPWSLEIYLQAIKRLHRQGQLQKVINRIIIAKGTVEEIVLARLVKKDFDQNELIGEMGRLTQDMIDYIRAAA
jgi:SNF2 family DNA or RNA helicase